MFGVLNVQGHKLGTMRTAEMLIRVDCDTIQTVEDPNLYQYDQGGMKIYVK